MAGTSPNHAAAVTDGGQGALSPPDALGARNMHHTENTLGKQHSISMAGANSVEEEHDVGKAMYAVLNTVSSRAIRLDSKTSLTPS